MKRAYDFVIFGASGFTGQFVVEYLARAVRGEAEKQPHRQDDQTGGGGGGGETRRPLTWAVAGRSEDKLKAVLRHATTATGIKLEAIPIILCDIDDEKSLVAMCSQAKVVLNCVGPYRFFGEQVVDACVRSGASHIDISGEPEYLEKMQLKYHEAAQEKGIYVIGGCGFDSIPSDVGQMLLAQKMPGDVNSMEMYLKVSLPENVSGPVINFGTWQSLIYGLANGQSLKPLRKQLFPEKLPTNLKPKLENRGVIHFSDVVNSYCLPFLGADRAVMMRTQRARYSNDHRRPTQIGCYVQVPSLFVAVMAILAGAFLALLTKFKCGLSLLEKYPGFFSCGYISKEGPSKEMSAETNFHMTLVGLGWKDAVKDPKENHDVEPNRRVTVTVSGKNVGYGATCECLVQAALVIVLESDRLPAKGGVLTPGYAFANTTLVERLNMNEVPFTVKVKDL